MALSEERLLSVRIEKSVVEALKKYKEETGISMAFAASKAITEYLQKQGETRK